MSKLGKAEKILLEKLDSTFAAVDAEFGRIMRRAKTNDCLETGETVVEVLDMLLDSAEHLSSALAKLHRNRSKPLLLGVNDYENEYKDVVTEIFSELAAYCYFVLKNVSLSTNQRHMYEKKYPDLHQSLESIKGNLLQEINRQIS